MTQSSETERAAPPAIRILQAHPWYVIAACFIIIALFGAGLKGVVKDPSVDAFVPSDHPASIARDEARDVFGLEDPVIIALSVPVGESVFTADRLDALRRTDVAIRAIEGVKKNDVISLASENALGGEGGDLTVEPIIPQGPITATSADIALERFRAMPMLSGLLASDAGDMVTLVVPVDDPNSAGMTVEAIKVAAHAQSGDVFDVHVSGVSAMNARLASMVDADTKIFVPAAVITVLLLIFVALRSFRALLGPLLVIAGSAAIAIGLMGWVDARYYLITTALPVVIMAIAVADSLHISTVYMACRREDPDRSAREAVAEALAKVWLPVALTSITTVAAFIGLSFGAAMQPISEFGIFAAVGVMAALLLSLTALPAILILTDLEPKPAQSTGRQAPRVDQWIAGLSDWAFARPATALGATVAALSCLALFAAQADFNYERQKYFSSGDDVLIADITIQERLGGVNFLDVIVTAEEPGALMTPKAIASIGELRRDMEQLPLVTKVGGIDEYISLMHAVLTGARYGDLPKGKRAPGQYMFLYEASGAPEDFKQEIDFDHTRALVRAQLSTDNYKEVQPTVNALELLTARWSTQNGLQAQISGRVAVNNGWMGQLSANHFKGLGLAIALVFITVIIIFRSLTYAALIMLPLLVGTLSVYAVMGLFAIDIAPATSMTAAIATGLGVDFGIHLGTHLRRSLRAGDSLRAALSGHYIIIARACFYSAVALGVALAVICISSAPPLRWFGFLVSVGAFGALVGALIMIPALTAFSTLIYNRRHSNA